MSPILVHESPMFRDQYTPPSERTRSCQPPITPPYDSAEKKFPELEATPKCYEPLTPPITPTDAKPTYSFHLSNPRGATKKLPFHALWSNPAALGWYESRFTLSGDPSPISPIVITEGVNAEKELVALEIKTTDGQRIALHWHKFMDTWTICQPLLKNGTPCDPDSADRWEVPSITWKPYKKVQKSFHASVFLRSTSTFALYREGIDDSGSVCEVHLLLRSHLVKDDIYLTHCDRRGWQCRPFGSDDHTSHLRAMSGLTLAARGYAVFQEASSHTPLWRGSDENVVMSDVFFNRWRDDIALPLWHRRARQVIRHYGEEAYAQTFTDPVPTWMPDFSFYILCATLVPVWWKYGFTWHMVSHLSGMSWICGRSLFLYNDIWADDPWKRSAYFYSTIAVIAIAMLLEWIFPYGTLLVGLACVIFDGEKNIDHTRGEISRLCAAADLFDSAIVSQETEGLPELWPEGEYEECPCSRQCRSHNERR